MLFAHRINRILIKNQISIKSFAKPFSLVIMKGISIKEFGDSNVCKYFTDLPVPEPQENQVI